MAKILNVFYGADNLPYKDKDRSVHFPIVGNAFQGASDTTEIHFYFDRIGEPNTSWVAVSKLPNGKIGSKVLNVAEDSELNENYAILQLSSFYTQYKGDLFISLQGYNGEVQVEYDESSELYTIKGTPTIQATGSIKLAINYATQFVGSGEESNADLQSMLSLLGTKLNIGSGIVVLTDLANTDLSSYSNGQLIYDKTTDAYYIKTNSSPYYQLANNNGLLGNKGALIRFFGLTDSITLQQIYNLIGANRYGALNIGGKEYLVIMSANNSIKAYDLLNKKLYDYIDAPQDTFADVLNEPATTFVEHISIANRIYGTDANAQETTILYSVNVVNNGIVQRGSDGQINVPTNPAYAYNAASKNYVDSNYGKKVQLTIDNDTFVLTVKLLNNNDVVISQANVDLPLESIVVSAQYYDTYTYEGTTYTKVLVIVLATTDNPIIAPVGDLVSGLVSETTFNNAVAQLQTNINKCVQQTNTANVVYGTNNVGTQTTIRYGTSVSANGLVQRDTLGQINVSATPSSNSNATSKQYVDTFGRTLEFSIDNSTYVMTFKLKDNNGNVISTQTIDLPLETMVVDGYYDSENESLVLELKNGNKITIPISDLISGLVTETSLATTLANYYTKSQIDQMVAGFVFADVDDYLSDSSTNPVENRVITNALEQKANVDGNYPTMTVGVADQLSPYDEESGADQNEPFILQGTGTANGTQTDFSTGSLALMKEKQGNSAVVNQLVPNNQKTFINSTVDTRDTFFLFIQLWNGNEYVTDLYNNINASNGLYILLLEPNNNGNRIVFKHSGSSLDLIFADFSCNVVAGQKYLAIINVISNNPSVAGGLKTKDHSFIKLTQWFGSNDAIPQDLLDHPENFYRYYQGSLAYNTGTLVNANSQYIKCIGRQQWDEEWESGVYSITVGSVVSKSTNANYIRSKNYIPVISGITYYFKLKTQYDKIILLDNNYVVLKVVNATANGDKLVEMPANCMYAVFYSYGTTYNHDITISLYYEGESGYDQYYQYEVLTNNDTGTEVLRSAGSVKDYKTPDGTIHRLVGVVDLGSLSWFYNDSLHFFFSTEIEDIILITANDVANILCAKYTTISAYTLTYGSDNKVIGLREDKRIAIRDTDYTDTTAFKSAISGVYLYYELATPTTEQGTPYSENLVIDDFGSMDFQGTNGVPQGNLIFYPVDYKAFIDTLYNYTEGTPSELALKTDLASDKQELSTVDSQLKEALGGTLRQLLATSKSIDFLNTAWVDLGELNWGAGGDSHTFITTIPNAKATKYGVNNAISTSYDNKGEAGYEQYTTYGNMTFGHESSSQNFYFANENYADATAFKNAMKGVLLAYEKASS